MDESFVEVKSALWQKLLATAFFLIIGGFGISVLLSPLVPIFSEPQPSIVLLILTGVFLFTLGLAFWWPVMRYRIRADENGISQTNGFFFQSASWSAVESYYLAVNTRFHEERGRHIEPFLLNDHGDIIFQGFAHIFVSTEAIYRQRQIL